MGDIASNSIDFYIDKATSKYFLVEKIYFRLQIAKYPGMPNDYQINFYKSGEIIKMVDSRDSIFSGHNLPAVTSARTWQICSI